jgi:maltooligosyltrehalose trehalohydrolase
MSRASADVNVHQLQRFSGTVALSLHVSAMMQLPDLHPAAAPVPAITTRRRLPVGAEIAPGGGVDFRVWAPHAGLVRVVLQRGAGAPDVVELTAGGDGYFAGTASRAAAGTLYRYRLEDDGPLLPDPASRFQPDGPHGPSRVVDPQTFTWSDAGWPGLTLPGQVFYELHVGTFTREGTWQAAARELPALAGLGVTALEVMPVADFPGRFGWGYDGVDLFAPTRLYGEPDDFRRFVDRAHALGLGVVLDVVYNHYGPDGCYLREFSPAWFSERYRSEWGEALNFDGADSGPVREFFVANAGYWIDEFHLDGLRLDATQSIQDASREHVIAALTRRARQAAGPRSIVVVAENEPQQVHLLRSPAREGYGVDALWSDDYHHAARVAVTGRHDAYYSDYRGTARELLALARHGFLYQGQRSTWQRKPRGTPTAGVPRFRLVTYTQNHDQVANSGDGRRLHALTSPGRWRAITALHLLGPGTPLLFQGQEFAASTPFLYFADHKPELAAAIREGRVKFLSQFRTLAGSPTGRLPDPGDPATFERCKLDPRERERHVEALALHRDLLARRRGDPLISAERGIDGAVLGEQALVLRWSGDAGSDRLLLVNLGPELLLDVVPEPLLAPPPAARWDVLWSSDDPRYGGPGTAPIETDAGWRLPAEAAVLLGAARPGAA